MTIPDLYALLERLAANADEQKRYRDAKEIKDGMAVLKTIIDAARGNGPYARALRGYYPRPREQP